MQTNVSPKTAETAKMSWSSTFLKTATVHQGCIFVSMWKGLTSRNCWTCLHTGGQPDYAERLVPIHQQCLPPHTDPGSPVHGKSAQ